MDKGNKKILLVTLALVTALLLGMMGYLYGPMLFQKQEPVIVVPDEVVDDTAYPEYRKLWDDNHAINEDYVGEVIFDSGLISLPFVQAKSTYKPNGEMYKFYTEDGRLVTDPTGYTGNNVYIWTYWKTGEYDYNDNGGSVFMDYRNELDDQNIIIYGHHFSVWNDETRSKAFTPLELLLEEENYKENSLVTLVLEHEIRHYVLVSVYQFNAFDERHTEELQYYRTDYSYNDYTDTVDPDYYDNYIRVMSEVEEYHTGVKLLNTDRTLTLQTCVSGHTGELFEILVLKQLNVEKY